MAQRVENFIAEIIIEDSWRLSRKFMLEIEHELEIKGQLPINMLLASASLQRKWSDYTRCN